MYSCERKEIVDRDILATSSNGDKKIMQSIRIMSRSPSRKKVEPVEPVQMATFLMISQWF